MTSSDLPPTPLTIQRYLIRAPENLDAGSATIEFGFSRTEVEKVVFGQSTAKEVVENRVFRLDQVRRNAHINDEGVEFQVHYRGEPPHISDTAWDFGSGLEKSRELIERSRQMTRAEAFDERLRIIKELDTTRVDSNQHPHASSLKERLLFFHQFDAATDPKTVEATTDVKTGDYDAFLECLKQRMQARADGRDPAPSNDFIHVRTARQLAKVVHPVFWQHFSDCRSTERIDDYFESFVSGDLALGHLKPDAKGLESHGGPNGAFYFALAEAAFFFHQYDNDPVRIHIWRQGLPTFVRTCAILRNHYYNGEGRSFSNYGYQWRAESPFPVDKRKQLRETFNDGRQPCLADLKKRFASECSATLANPT